MAAMAGHGLTSREVAPCPNFSVVIANEAARLVVIALSRLISGVVGAAPETGGRYTCATSIGTGIVSVDIVGPGCRIATSRAESGPSTGTKAFAVPNHCISSCIHLPVIEASATGLCAVHVGSTDGRPTAAEPSSGSVVGIRTGSVGVGEVRCLSAASEVVGETVGVAGCGEVVWISGDAEVVASFGGPGVVEGVCGAELAAGLTSSTSGGTVVTILVLIGVRHYCGRDFVLVKVDAVERLISLEFQ